MKVTKSRLLEMAIEADIVLEFMTGYVREVGGKKWRKYTSVYHFLYRRIKLRRASG